MQQSTEPKGSSPAAENAAPYCLSVMLMHEAKENAHILPAYAHTTLLKPPAFTVGRVLATITPSPGGSSPKPRGVLVPFTVLGGQELVPRWGQKWPPLVGRRLHRPYTHCVCSCRYAQNTHI
eukprot:GDKI01025908.1.p2 GENE.GDKI01025908.1~~GDKI01025908.1.p2  ORF type:complete len:122 (+),score=3.85 GDKI01025908.1:124-489(+)